MSIKEKEYDKDIKDVIRFVSQFKEIRTTTIQLQFQWGYNRVGRLFEQMEELGIISSLNGAKPRDVLVNTEQAEVIINQL